jgi:hypothetical protein
MLALVRAVAANWNLGRQLEASKPGRPSTFFSAKIAATFTQLRADLLKTEVLNQFNFMNFNLVAPKARLPISGSQAEKNRARVYVKSVVPFHVGPCRLSCRFSRTAAGEVR